ncbi:alpha/beta fold hydrolase, partial [Helicobacter sp. T3_23-1056]
MKHDIRTHEADLSLVIKFLDYANCADASYAMLNYVFYGKLQDAQKLGDTFNGQNSTYARAIEARFNNDKVDDWCMPFTDTCFSTKDKIANNDISAVTLDFKLSKRTIDFVNRFKILAHQPNTTNGFSATLFEDTNNANQKILAIRGTEIGIKDIITDIVLAKNDIPLQCYELAQFYEEIIKQKIGDKKLVVVGHSLGGYLAQAFCFMYPNIVKEAYTYNAVGLLADFIKFLIKYNINPVVSVAIDNLPNKLHKYDSVINVLKTNIKNYGDKLPPPLVIDNIHHIKTDDDSIADNNYYHKNVIQFLGNDIQGKMYLINVDTFWGSHFLAPTIAQLQIAINYLNANKSKTLLDFNQKIQKDKENELNFLEKILFDFGVKLTPPMPNIISHNLIPPSMPKPSKDLQESIAYLQTNSLPKEPRKVMVASNSNGFSKLEIQALENYTAKMNQYNDDLIIYNQHKEIYNKHYMSYKDELRSFAKSYANYQDSLYIQYQAHNAILANQIALQFLQKDLWQDYNFYEILQALQSYNAYYTFADFSNIDSITLQDLQDNANLGYFYCLYHCNPLVVLNSTNHTMLNENLIIKNFGYNSSFYLSFITNKESLSDSYLDSRKALYKSIMQIKEQKAQAQKQEIDSINVELKDLDSKQREAILNEIQKEQKTKIRESQKQDSFNQKANSTNDLILQNNGKTSTIIFLDSSGLALKPNANRAKSNLDSRLDSSIDTNLNANLDSKPSMSNLIHIYNKNNQTKIDIFTKHNTIIDIYELVKNYSEYGISLDSLHSANTQIFLYSILLNGGTESTMPYSECFFGDLGSNNNPNFNNSNANDSDSDSSARDSNDSTNTDSNNDLDESKPIYYLECDEVDLDSNDSNDSAQTLQVFLNNHKLTILNYSILDSSLNIKLECKSKESKAIQQNEQAQRDKAQIQSSTPSISTALLCPILECDELKCTHGGQVKLTSNIGKTIKAKTKDDSSKDSPIMLESDLLYSPILNCPNNLAGIPSPCTQVALILPNARGLKKYNDDYPIMQDLCVSGVFSDKGFPIICTPKPNTLKIQSPKPSNNNAESKEALESNVDFSIPTLSIITAYDGLDEFYFTPSIYESRKSSEVTISSQANFYNANKSLDISFDSISNDDFPNDLANNNVLESVLESLTHIYDKKHFSY